MKKLNLTIVECLAKKLRISSSTVKKNIYLRASKYPKATKNAVAQIYAQERGETIFRKLDKNDKESLPNFEIENIKIKVKGKTKKNHKKPPLKTLINYETEDYFKKGHIEELHRTYTHKCYTATFVLARKIVENLIIDILREKFPKNKKIYFDINQGRFHDFSIILKNLLKNKTAFGSLNKAVERLYNLALSLKKDANDKTHSWFHLVKNEKEIENLELKAIIEIIKSLEKDLKK
jgi:hypothetical protein